MLQKQLETVIKVDLQEVSNVVLVSEDTSKLNNKLSTSLGPWNLFWVPDIYNQHGFSKTDIEL